MRNYSANVADHVVLDVKVFQIFQVEQILNALQFAVVNRQNLDVNGHVVQFLEVDVQDAHVYELFNLRFLQIGGIFHNVARWFGHFWLKERIKCYFVIQYYICNSLLLKQLNMSQNLKL
ncbi:Hypothetical_protein [Hexamita inflata]|uniref:Hypothetical_protein n=1 Tax=Hexamita inflata TaxID=28002 RepID=A0AA86VPP7_9EUKA|nr:Hypothetical protein HINF_LOCUS60213 [Hexamita inflata]